MNDFIAKKREIFLVQMSLDTKRAEITKLEERALQVRTLCICLGACLFAHFSFRLFMQLSQFVSMCVSGLPVNAPVCIVCKLCVG